MRRKFLNKKTAAAFLTASLLFSSQGAAMPVYADSGAASEAWAADADLERGAVQTLEAVSHDSVDGADAGSLLKDTDADAGGIYGDEVGNGIETDVQQDNGTDEKADADTDSDITDENAGAVTGAEQDGRTETGIPADEDAAAGSVMDADENLDISETEKNPDKETQGSGDAGTEEESGMDGNVQDGDVSMDVPETEEKNPEGEAQDGMDDGTQTDVDTYMPAGDYVELNDGYETSGVSIRWHEDKDLIEIINENPGRRVLTKDMASHVVTKGVSNLYISGFTSIYDHAFEDAAGLKDIVIADALETTGNYTFMGCTSLESVSFPDTLEEVGAYAFYKCSKLRMTELPPGIKKLRIGAFWDCSSIALKSLPDVFDEIEGHVFRGCRSLELESLPAGITGIGDSAFADCELLEFTELPAGVTSIGTGAFFGCKKLALTKLPDGADSIGASAFANCEQLALTKLPDGITEIKMSTFGGCKNLALTEFPAGLTKIELAAFSGCSSLGRLEFPAGLKSIGNLGFYGCTLLDIPEFPAGLESVGREAFKECSSLSLESLPESLVDIGNYVFEKCTSLQKMTICGSITSLPEGIFDGCAGLESVRLPETVASIGSYAFARCESLEQVNLPAGLSMIGDRAFYMAPALNFTELPDSLEYIGEYAFYNCKGLEMSAFPDSLEFVGGHAFHYADGVIVDRSKNADISDDHAVLAYYTVQCITGTSGEDYDETDIIGSRRNSWYYGEKTEDALGHYSTARPKVDGYRFVTYVVPEGNEKIMLTNDESETVVYAVFTPEPSSTFLVSLPAEVEMDDLQADGSGMGVFTGEIGYQVSYRLKDDNTALTVCLLDAENGGGADASYLQHGDGDSGSFAGGTGGAITCVPDKSVAAWTNGNARSGMYHSSYRTEGKYGTAVYNADTKAYEGSGTIAVMSRFAVKETGTYSGHAAVVIRCR